MRQLLAKLDTTPGTLADDIGTGIAMAAMMAATWFFWVATP